MKTSTPTNQKALRPTSALLVTLIALLTLLSPTGSPTDDLQARPGLIERRNQEKIRAAGFADVELDRLHAEIGKAVFDLKDLALSEDEKPSDPAAKPTDPQQGKVEPAAHYEDSIEIQPSRMRSFMKGTDRNGRTYYRLRIRDGLNFTTEPTPSRFIFKAHAYLYIDDQGKLSEVLLQFYRMRFSGMEYTREIRRIRHPGPFGAGAAQSPMQVEFRSYPRSLAREDLSADDVPRPVLSGNPQLTTMLHNADDPIPFDKQSRIVETYRSLLRKINSQLAKEREVLLLNRNSAIERALDFTGTSF